MPHIVTEPRWYVVECEGDNSVRGKEAEVEADVVRNIFIPRYDYVSYQAACDAAYELSCIQKENRFYVVQTTIGFMNGNRKSC